MQAGAENTVKVSADAGSEESEKRATVQKSTRVEADDEDLERCVEVEDDCVAADELDEEAEVEAVLVCEDSATWSEVENLLVRRRPFLISFAVTTWRRIIVLALLLLTDMVTLSWEYFFNFKSLLESNVLAVGLTVSEWWFLACATLRCFAGFFCRSCGDRESPAGLSIAYAHSRSNARPR